MQGNVHEYRQLAKYFPLYRDSLMEILEETRGKFRGLVATIPCYLLLYCIAIIISMPSSIFSSRYYGSRVSDSTAIRSMTRRKMKVRGISCERSPYASGAKSATLSSNSINVQASRSDLERQQFRVPLRFHSIYIPIAPAAELIWLAITRGSSLYEARHTFFSPLASRSVG